MRLPRSPIGRLVWRARRHLAVGRYLAHLPRQLLTDYGHGGPYTPGQVEATLGRNATFSFDFAPYAQLLFSDRPEVSRAWREARLELDYELLRRWVGDAFFGGDLDFTEADVARRAARDNGWPRDPTANDWHSIVS